MIRGIGGLFIYARDAQALVEWYRAHLGLSFAYESSEGSYYKDFVLARDPAYGRTEREVFAIRQCDPMWDGPGRPFVINWRVHDLEALLKQLQAAGVAIVRTESYDYGRFAWLEDLEGNELELFEPCES